MDAGMGKLGRRMSMALIVLRKSGSTVTRTKPTKMCETMAITASDGQLAKLAVPEAQSLWPKTTVVALAAGNKGWRHAGYDMEPGFDRATTDANDVWYKPYDHEGDVVEQHMRDYLTWEIALVEQLDRDPTVSFPTFT